MKKSIFAILTLAAAVFAAEEMEELKVTALARESTVSQTPGGITSLTNYDIATYTPLSVSDMCIKMPGVSKSSDARWGSEMVIRGLSRNRIVFVIDGMRVNTATDVGVQFGLLLPDDVSRIEVLKGPVSEIYGSGSLGGVVNVTTKSGRFTDSPEFHGGISLSASSNGEGVSTYANAFYSDKDFWLFASAGYRNYNGYKDGNRDKVMTSQLEDMQGTLKGAYKWDSHNVTEITLRRYRAVNVGVPGAEGLPAIASRVTLPETIMDSISLKHTISDITDFWTESRLNLYATRIDRDVKIDKFRSGQFRKMMPSAVHRTFGGRWDNIFEFDDHKIVWGVDYWRWEYSGTRTRIRNNNVVIHDKPMAKSNQNSLGVYAEDDWQIAEKLTLNFGGRVDRIWAHSEDLYNATGTTIINPESSDRSWSWSTHVGLTYQIADAWSMTLLLSRANRAPDIMDRFKYITVNPMVTLFGNPELDDEHSYFGEYGIHFKNETFTADACVFINSIEDMIVQKTVNANTIRMDNVNHALLYGAEFNVDWKFADGWDVFAYIAWMEGKDRTDDVYLRNNPPINGDFGIRYTSEIGIWALAELEWALRQTKNNPNVKDCNGHSVVNLQVGYDFDIKMTHHSIILSANNIFDEKYRNYLSTIRGNNSDMAYYEPGQSFTIAWKMEF